MGRPEGYGIDDRRIQVKYESGSFSLLISKAQLRDTAVYICLKTLHHKLEFLNGVDLRVEALEPNGTAVTLTEENSVYCFKARSYQPPLSFTCNEENTFGECDKIRDGQWTKKCVFSLFKNISSSEASSQYCAVAACEETESENGSEINNEAEHVEKKEKTVLFVLSAALALSLLVVAFLLYSVKKLQNKSCDCSTASVVLQTASGHQENQQTDEDSLVYSRVTFTSRKSSQAARREAKPSEEGSIYTGFGLTASTGWTPPRVSLFVLTLSFWL